MTQTDLMELTLDEITHWALCADVDDLIETCREALMMGATGRDLRNAVGELLWPELAERLFGEIDQ